MSNSNSRSPFPDAPGVPPSDGAPSGEGVSASGQNGRLISSHEETVFSTTAPSGERVLSGEGAPPVRHDAGAPAPSEERATALALVERGEARRERNGGRDPEDNGSRERDGQNGAMEVADDASIRDFYAQLVTLLTQDNTARAPVKKNRAGLKEALRRRLWPALALFLLTFGALGYLLRPKQATYTSSVVLLLPPRDTQVNKDPLSSGDEAYDAPAQIAIIGSEQIVREAMRHVSPDVRKRGFGDRNAQMAPVDVTPAGSDQLVAITVSSLDPGASIITANAMVNAYINYTRNRFSQNRNENRNVTRKRAQTLSNQLLAVQLEKQAFKERNGILDYNSEQSSASNNIAGLQSALDAARRDAASAATNDATLLSLQERVNTAQAAYDKEKRNYFEDAPSVVAAKADLTAAQSQVATRRSTVEAEARNRIAQLEASLNAARQKASGLPGLEEQLNRLNEREQTLQTSSRAANERLSQLGLLGEAVAPVAKPLSSPSVGSSQGMQRARALAVALLSALALSTLGAWLLDRSDKSVRTAPDPEVLFGAPVLGALPATNEHRTFYLAPTASNKGNARARTQTIEACTNAQNNILAAATAAGARSILLTSALPQEGKSGCASNLAAAMAYGGREVLLVDVDFWHPSQHSNFDMELTPGYAQVLRDNLPLSEAIRPTPVANLFLLSTGQDASTPGDIIGLLQGRTHRGNMEVLKKYFDIIVLDAPPTMTVSDAQLLSGLADAVVLVTAEKTHRDEVQRARSMLRLAGAWILGVVVNSVRPGEMGGWNLNFSGEEPFADYSQSLRTRGRGH